MARRMYVLFADLFVLTACSLFSAGAAAEAGWKAGVARGSITPREPMWMAGYAARNHPAEGKLHDLWIKVLALEDAAGRLAVIVTSDLCGFSKINYDAIAADAKARCGLDRAQLKLTCSHTFKQIYGPRTWVNGYTNDVMSYIPSKRVLEEGGYEAGGFAACGLPADTWGPDIEERITSSVERLVPRQNE